MICSIKIPGFRPYGLRPPLLAGGKYLPVFAMQKLAARVEYAKKKHRNLRPPQRPRLKEILWHYWN